jgi:hydrogenase expression/formation protein HypC
VCLAIPGRIDAIEHVDGLDVALVDFGGLRKQVCLATLPDARVGDWILVHAGFALQRLEACDAQELLGWIAGASEPQP